MQPINQLVDKTNNKNTLATPFRLPNNVTGAQTAIIDEDITNSQQYIEVDNLKTNSSYAETIFYKEQKNSKPQDNNKLVVTTSTGTNVYYANETITLLVNTNNNTLSWSLSGLNSSNVSIQPANSSALNTKVAELKLKDSQIGDQPLSFVVTVTDTTTKKQGTIKLTLNPVQNLDTLRVTVDSIRVDAEQTAKVTIHSPVNPITYTVEANESFDTTLLQVDEYFSSGAPGSTALFIRHINPEYHTEDAIITVKATESDKNGSVKFTLLKYVNKDALNTTTNEAIITTHVDTFKDAYDVAKIHNTSSVAGEDLTVTVTTEGQQPTTYVVKDLELLTIPGVSVSYFSGWEYWFINLENNYKVITITTQSNVDLRPRSYVNHTPNNTTYNGKNVHTLYLAPDRSAHRNSQEVMGAEQKGSSTNVIRLFEQKLATPTRATLIINNRYLYVNEKFDNSPGNDLTELLSRASSFFTVQDSSSLIAVYPQPNKRVEATLIFADKTDPTLNQTVYPDTSLFYDKVNNITTFTLTSNPPS